MLRFLSDKTLAGEADQLKEYSVGIDAFGKPPDYDPRHDSAVRIQVGRLRQKLAEYYMTDGKDDEIIVELPKGGFRVQFETRPARVETVIVAPPPPVAPVPVEEPRPSRLVPILAAALTLSVLWAGWSTYQLVSERSTAESSHAAWTPALEALWQPFITDNRPLLVAVSSPLFVGLKGHAYYRDLTINRWEDVLQDSHLKSVRKSLGDPDIFPHRSYTGIGDANAVFLVGKLLGTRRQNISFAKTSDLSWQQMADSNVILIGTPRSFNDLLKGLPADFQMTLETNGLRINKPAKGEPDFLGDQTISGQRLAATPEDGEVYALITRSPGPNGTGTIAGFSSNLNSGTLAAVQWFTDHELAAGLTEKLKGSSGKLPRYFQLALKVRFKGGVPTETSYVMHRELHSTAASGR